MVHVGNVISVVSQRYISLLYAVELSLAWLCENILLSAAKINFSY